MSNHELKKAAARRLGCVVAAIGILGMPGCYQNDFTPETTATVSPQPGSSLLAGSVSLTVYDSSTGQVVFGEGSSGGAQMTVGKSYVLHVSAANLPSGATIQLQTEDISVVGGAMQTQTLQVGDNTWTPPAVGTYTFTLSVENAGGAAVQAKYYQAYVQCQTPTFTANSLNPSGIVVTAGSGSNLYNFSAAGVAGGANGQAPYQCAYDLTGVGILDTGFSPCSRPQLNQYVNYVGIRNIGVIVKDSCGTAYSVSAPQTLPWSTPAMGQGNVFIQGQVSNAMSNGSPWNDPRVNNVSYLATNAAGNTSVVQPSYDWSGGTTFTIKSSKYYGQPSSVQFGMTVEVAGLGGSFNLASDVSGQIDTSSAYIKSISYSTDQAGDQDPAVSMTSTSCTTSGIHAQVLNPQGQPCTGGSAVGSNNQATVEVWGSYDCNVSDASGETATIIGEFDGLVKTTDSCIGGGGGGDGGIVPVEF